MALQKLYVHWCLCRKYGLEIADKWYEQVPGKVWEHENIKILSDFSIQTDHQLVLEHNRPDLVKVDKQQAVCQIIDVAVPGDARVELKETENIDKYQDLARELRKLGKVKTRVGPIVIWALWTIPKGVVLLYCIYTALGP